MINKDMRRTAAKGRLTLQERAERRAADLAPIIAEIQASGVTSLQQIADTVEPSGPQTAGPT